MYQSLLRLHTVCGGTFKEIILNSLENSTGDGLIAALFAVRAEGSHEHHMSPEHETPEHQPAREQQMHGGHSGH